MQNKTIHRMHVFCFETETTFQEILQYVRIIARKLYEDAIKHDLEITGPVYWIYNGADGQPDTRFSLTIALPISPTKQDLIDSDFKIKTLDFFNCVSQQHLGDWSKLGETYDMIISEIQSSQLTMNGQNREIYLNMDFENPDGNVTEVQVGIVSI